MAERRTGWRRLSILAVCLLALLRPSGADAQTFGPPVATELVLVLLDREGNARFTLSGFYTRWENPFQIAVDGLSRIDGKIYSKQTKIAGDTPASPLVEGTYILSRRWSVGFWYNPIRGERLGPKTVNFGRKDVSPVTIALERDVNLGDLHVTYYAPHGSSLQLGYYREWGTYRELDSTVRTEYVLQSWNVWLMQRIDLLFRNRLTTDRLGRHLMTQFVPFVSVGYHPAGGLNHATSVLAGLGVTFNEKITLSGSVWFFDLAHPDTRSKRITGGLVIRY